MYRTISQVLMNLNLKLLLKWVILVEIIIGCTPTTPLPLPLEPPKPRQEVPTTSTQSLNYFQLNTTDYEKEYLLGAGDHLTVEVWGYPELSGQHTIGPDGKITLPLIGSLRITDLSREQVSKLITTRLSPYYTDLSVAVRVDQYAANRILVLGRVAHPGEIQFGMTTPTLLEAISLAGGFANASGLPEQAQSLLFTHCAIFRGRDRIVWIELEPLIMGKDLSLNIKLQRNDIIYVPDIEEKLVYVFGEVRNPGAFPLTPAMSFVELLARAGGPTQDAAPDRINVIRPTQGINRPIALKELIVPNQKFDVALQEGDIIYVPTNTITKVNYALQFLNPFTTMLGIYSNITSIQANNQRRQLDQEKERLETERAKIDAIETTNSLE